MAFVVSAVVGIVVFCCLRNRKKNKNKNKIKKKDENLTYSTKEINIIDM